MRAEPTTLLCLADFAKILGLDPLHFAGGYSTLRPEPTCTDVWFQYDWQNADLVSRHQVATVIHEAEQDIADALGYWPAPTWLYEEIKEYPRLYRRDLTGMGQDVRFRLRGLPLKYGYVLEGGQRATTLIAADVAYTTSDPDGDGFNELATFTIPGVSSTLDVCGVRGYYKAYDVANPDDTRTDPSSTGADPAWEVRPLRVSLSGTTLTIRCNVWDLFSPQLFEELAPDGIDADAAASYVDGLDFYLEYNDPTEQVEFGWAADATCTDVAACTYDTQAGCLRIKDSRNGLVTPTPSTYNATTGTFTYTNWKNTWEPDVIRVWYRAGLTERNVACETLPTYWARTITMLAVSRLDWPVCTCSNKNNLLLSDKWRQDMAEVLPDHSYITYADVLANPFGTRVGEVEAWKRVAKARGRARGKAVFT